METVTVRFEEKVLKNIDKAIDDHNFNSRTEFLREAVRDKLSSLSREDLINEFMKFQGKSKIKTTREQNRKAADLALREFAKAQGWD